MLSNDENKQTKPRTHGSGGCPHLELWPMVEERTALVTSQQQTEKVSMNLLLEFIGTLSYNLILHVDSTLMLILAV